MSDDEDDVCLHKGVRVPNGPYLTFHTLSTVRSARYRPEIETPLKQLVNTFIHCLFQQQVRQLLANKIH